MSLGPLQEKARYEIALLSSDDYLQCHDALLSLTRLAGNSLESKKVVVESGALTASARFLRSNNTELQYAACSLFAKISAGPPQFKQAILDCGALTPLLQLAANSTKGKVLTGVWYIFNEISDGTNDQRQVLLDQGILPQLVRLLRLDMNDAYNQPLLLGLMGVIINISRAGDRPRQAVHLSGAVPCLAALLNSKFESVQAYAARALANVAIGDEKFKQAVLDCNVIPRLCQLLQSGSEKLTIHVCRVLGNLADTDEHRQVLINAGVLEILVPFIKLPGDAFCHRACTVLLNIANGQEKQRQAVIDAKALPNLVAVLSSKDPQICDLSCRCIANISHGSIAQKQAIIDAGALPPLVKLLDSTNRDLALVASKPVITIGNRDPKQRQAVIDAGAVPILKMLIGKRSQAVNYYSKSRRSWLCF